MAAAPQTIHGGRDRTSRQSVLALAAGHGLADHEAPGEATLQVLTGHVRLSTADESWEGRPGDYLVIPARRHNLEALEDSAVLLTVGTTG
jgi:quercetin dioxygenase-like cupin family protein